MQTQVHIGQDVLYTRPQDKGECPAKVVRVVNPNKDTVNLIIFTDDTENTSVIRGVAYNEAGGLENTWRHDSHHEQARAAGSNR